MPSNFWMIVNNERNFRITQGMGFSVMGLKAQHRRKVQRISDGDRILMYLTHIRRFAATATAISDYFESEDSVWEKEGRAGFPFRVNIRPEIVLSDEQLIDANLIAPRAGIREAVGPRGLVHGLPGQPPLAPQERLPAHRRGNEEAALRQGLPAHAGGADAHPAASSQARRSAEPDAPPRDATPV